jgi:hypothetical protein
VSRTYTVTGRFSCERAKYEPNHHNRNMLLRQGLSLARKLRMFIEIIEVMESVIYYT